MLPAIRVLTDVGAGSAVRSARKIIHCTRGDPAVRRRAMSFRAVSPLSKGHTVVPGPKLEPGPCEPARSRTPCESTAPSESVETDDVAAKRKRPAPLAAPGERLLWRPRPMSLFPRLQSRESVHSSATRSKSADSWFRLEPDWAPARVLWFCTLVLGSERQRRRCTE